MPLVQLKWKPLDKLLLLWTICVIDYRRQLSLSCSYAAIKQEFGEEGIHIFQTYCNAAIDQRLLNWETMQLTKKGLVACQYWQEISEQIYQ